MAQIMVILVAVIAILGVVMVLRKPRWAVLVILVMYPLEQILQSYFPALRATPWIFNVTVGGLAGFAVLMRIAKREPLMSGATNAILVLILLMYLLSWASLAWTPSREIAGPRMIASVPYVAVMLGCTALLLDDLEDFRRLAVGTMVVGIVIVLLILLNPMAGHVRGRLQLELGAYAVGQSTGSNSLALATMGGMIALVAVLIRFERGSRLMFVVRAAAFFLGLGLAVGSGSRGQVLAACLVGVLFYPIARPLARPSQFFVTAGGLAVVLLGLYVTFSLFIGDANRKRWDVFQLDADAGGRFEMSLALFEAWLATPGAWIAGLGVNAFVTVTPFGGTPYVHNLFTEVLCELGIIGAVLLGLAVFMSYRHWIWLWRRYRDHPQMRSVAAFLGAMFFYSLLLGLKQGSFTLNATSLMWWAILGAVASREQALAAEEPAWEAEDDEAYGYQDYGDYGEEHALAQS